MKKDEKILKHQQEELQKLIEELTGEAIKVVEDYTKNPSELSGSVTQTHVESPILNENLIDNGGETGNVIK